MSTSITVRDIDPADKSWLRREARQTGVSMEELVRRLIRLAGLDQLLGRKHVRKRKSGRAGNLHQAIHRTNPVVFAVGDIDRAVAEGSGIGVKGHFSYRLGGGRNV